MHSQHLSPQRTDNASPPSLLHNPDTAPHSHAAQAPYSYQDTSSANNSSAAELDLDAWILQSPTIPTPPYDPLAALATPSAPVAQSFLDPDTFDLELENALLGVDVGTYDPSAFQALELQLAHSQGYPDYNNNLYAAGTYINSHPGSTHSPGAFSPSVASHPSFAYRAASGFADDLSSVYSDAHSAHNSVGAYSAHRSLFRAPQSPSAAYASLDLPPELDLARFASLSSPHNHNSLVNGNSTMQHPSAPRSHYSTTSSIAPSSLSNVPQSTHSHTGTAHTALSQNSVGTNGDPERKHVCPHCPRAFARAYNLKTHIATHDPQRPKPYKCPYASCGRGFSRKHDLGRHVVSVHEKGEREPGTGSINGSVNGGERKVKTEMMEDGVEKVWCDGCGRGWVKGMKAGCVCDEERIEEGKVKWEDNK